ncbi:type II toxin-antitoxin system death-on-curing family toxin [Aetokthonos hydrillicola Thurmond2011]|jgi:death-on-curing protein|uniref:Type II toxin-antitoxin system death-on-curing family toxin n=1 Tax=Aetokthonos hydrillicola Thurmond2011 TaxID=2712845 RepID=A0AAP5M4R4_9CYAN|nr:type II toxin-antitoxin system death-on-curing family toxin [Aetokthonos hydrillicola]MBO3459813.1 type II toxin-antitoxin system death-on-curing family toxin [Aetokthonos hydrillicola CCALA 1050]MBW4584542.1 type II toxin-antitoxin system death-on-curing family toxin [Aetokthonos hydrillicola CCALA 1050]MDR9895086.1 type II toxin-antitoxin system death-on-curing family toxin [Aetokthonos hydrillicola Thurmond2011]
MKEPTWIPLNVVQVIHAQQVAEYGGLPGVRDQGLLLSALTRPKNLLAYDENINLYDLAAPYAYGIIRNHPFIDGNKRTGLAVALTFLLFNDAPLIIEEVEAAVMIEMLAAGDLTESQLAEFFKGIAKKL